jgi:hypothetical protein
MSRTSSLHFPPEDPGAGHPWKQYRAPAAGRLARKDNCAEPATELTSNIVDDSLAPSIKIDTPFGLYHAALRESENAQRALRRIGTDASSEAHGALTVALAALRKTVDAVTALIEMEAGPFESRDPK